MAEPQRTPDLAPSGNQLATIAKLSRLLGIDAPPAPLTHERASEQITELCARYNAMGASSRFTRSQRPDQRLWERMKFHAWVQDMESRA